MGSLEYAKHGSGEQEFVAERGVCVAHVEDVFNPYQDFGSPMQRSTEAERMMAARLEQERLFRRCMEQRGWRVVIP